MGWLVRKKAVGAAVFGLLMVAGCSSGGGSGSTPSASAPSANDGGTASPSADAAGAEAAYRKWGLKPFAAPPAPPAEKPVKAKPGEVPVVSDIPTKDKIVFVTFDDGAEKDPKFVEMMKDLKIPFTMFLTDDIIRNDYGYFKPLQELGNSIENHTLSHPNLRTLGEAAQKNEICTQEKKLGKEYGKAPRLFRPPYGNWNENTRSAAKSCDLQAIVLWRESMQITNMQYQRGDKKLHPGDIILAHFRGPKELKGTSMTEMTANMLRHIQEQGFTVARLEDYV
ncbi:polysaccharide deacetylase family protein [Streptomyces sp. WM6378]|uniref:polysaccharide deacetylase family protein n=1 Tax=Streptomyces sp. WM6378 TaxID=1415557 RepID=UPI0006AF6265|nr:polysaccharide deacetylase family protein [Streptomyces sp. WM6378]KOU40150.1 polysaccharide/chitin/xylan deacetylase [Streptomyces sp. WM6378]